MFIIYHFQVIASYLSKVTYFNLPHLLLVPPLEVTPFEFFYDLWHRKLESLGYCVALLA